jgi:hypothetical protein
MDDTNAGLLKSIDRLVEALAKRVTFWPSVEDDETETSKLSFAHLLAEKYVEMLGSTRVVNIAHESVTEEEMLEAIQEEIDLKETSELENHLWDKEGIIVDRNGQHSR